MYPAVELGTALLFVACYFCFGLSLLSLKWISFCCLLVVLVVTDFRERILPDVVNWFGVGLGLVFAAYVPPVDGLAPLLLHGQVTLPRWSSGVLDAVLGAVFCGGVLLVTAWLYKGIRPPVGTGFCAVTMMFI